MSYLILAILGSGVYISVATSQSSSARANFSSQGTVSSLQSLDVDVDFSRTIAINNLSLGVQIYAQELQAVVNDADLRSMFLNCDFGIIRFFVHQTQPCTSWDEEIRTGTYNWSRFDQEVQALQQLDTKILIVVGVSLALTTDGLPKGMDSNFNGTGFPNPESFAAYCKDIAIHLSSKGWNIEYWEPYNEPLSVKLPDGTLNQTAYEAFVDLFNLASEAVVQILPSAKFGVDVSNSKVFLDHFAHDGKNVGFLSFHKYDADATELYNSDKQVNDTEILQRASNLGRWCLTPQQMTDEWQNLTGVILPVFCTETNMNDAYINGTDPRIQGIIGGVWYAEELRAFILSDVRYSVYYTFASDDSPRWNTTKQTKGYGFGMVKSTPPYLQWYPYFVNLVIGSNLNVGDRICSCSSSNTSDLSTLAWISKGSYNVLLVRKTNTGSVNVSVNLANLNLERNMITILRIDESTPQLQTFQNSFVSPFVVSLNGYSVLLLKFL